MLLVAIVFFGLLLLGMPVGFVLGVAGMRSPKNTIATSSILLLLYSFGTYLAVISKEIMDSDQQ